MAAVRLRRLRVLCEPFATSAVKRSLVGGLLPAVAGVRPPYDLRLRLQAMPRLVLVSVRLSSDNAIRRTKPRFSGP